MRTSNAWLWMTIREDTVSVAKQFPVKGIELSENHEPAHARNFGSKCSSADILIFIDSDVLIFPETISKIVQAFQEHKDVAAIIGSYDDQPHETSFISEFKNLFHHYVHQKSSELASTFWSGCGAIRKNVFMEAGGFSESFKRPAIEDIELGYRLRKTHHKIMLKKEIQVKHLKRWTFWGLIKTDVLDRGIPWTHLMLRDRSMLNDLNVSMSQRLSVFLVYLLLLTSVVFVGFFKQLMFLPVLIFLTVLIITLTYIDFLSKKEIFLLQPWPFRFTFSIIITAA
ncbi:glycosyltransferase [candidate division KSB1 bacterium]|nr:glycosyltransferase [candidate division KSB1 bacterium]